MANASFGDAARDQMRTLIDTIHGEIARLRSSDEGATAALHASWSELVNVLALGPKPQMRECPVCHGSGLRAASRCSRCWSKLEPLPALAEGVHAPIASLSAAAGVPHAAGSNL